MAEEKTEKQNKAKTGSETSSKARTKSSTASKKSAAKSSKSSTASKKSTTKSSKSSSTSKSKATAKSSSTSKSKATSKSSSSAKKTATKSSSTSKKATAKSSSTSKSKATSKSSSRSGSTRKKKTEELENQQSWDLEQKPAEPEEPVVVDVAEEPTEPAKEPAEMAEPAPQTDNKRADNGTKEISIDDYQPVIWITDTEDTAAETALSESDKSDQVSADNAEKTSENIQEDVPASEDVPDEVPASEDVPGQVSSNAPAGAAIRIAGAAFVGVLVLMLVLNTVTKDILYSDQENRVFQQLPKFSVSNYLSGRFESQLDNYVSDQFAGRNAFIKIKSAADLTIGQIKANGVFKANDNYLMEDITYPDEAGVAADTKALKKFKKKYPEKKMYFMLVPNAANILAEKLPASVVTRDQNKDIDMLLNTVKELGYKPIDVREELKAASKKQQVYYRTDHHWTTDGAYVAYKKAAEVMKLKSEIEYEPKVVKKDFVGTLYSKSGFTNGRKDAIKIYMPAGDKYLNSVIRYKDKKEKTTMYYDMANLDIKDAYTVFGGTNQSLITISTPTKKNKHLLVVKDSYANCFIPFLTQDYRTITIVDPRYYYENIATVMKADEIDDVLFLYNANTFFSDNYMRMMLTNK